MALNLNLQPEVNDKQDFVSNQILTSKHMNDLVKDLKKAAAADSVEAALTINGTTTTKDVGGIPAGTNLEGKNVTEILELLLFPYVAPSGLSITTMQSAGAYERGVSVVISSITPKFTKGSKTVNQLKVGTTNGGSNLLSKTGETITSNATQNLTTNAEFSSNGTIYCRVGDGTTEISTTAEIKFVDYHYSCFNNSPDSPSTTGLTQRTATGGQAEYSYSSGQYLWLYSKENGKTIQTNVAGSWANVNTTQYNGQVEITQKNGAKAKYYAYRTDKFTASGKATYKLA